MPAWTSWKLLQDGSRAPTASDSWDLPGEEFGVYELGLGRSLRSVASVYLGSATGAGGLGDRLRQHRGLKDYRDTITNKGHHIQACINKGWKVFFRVRYTRTAVQAKELERELAASWWCYPWNDQ